jgi:hypothetical protein
LALEDGVFPFDIVVIVVLLGLSYGLFHSRRHILEFIAVDVAERRVRVVSAEREVPDSLQARSSSRLCVERICELRSFGGRAGTR